MSGVYVPQMAPYQGASKCTGTVAPGARALMAFWLEEYKPIGTSLGIYNCRTVRGGSTTSLHGEGRACDLGVPIVSGGHRIMWQFLNRLAPHMRRLGIQYFIFARKQWADHRDPNGEYYGGVAPHFDHSHMELSWNAANNLTLSTLRAVVGSTEKDLFMFVEHGDNDENLKGEPVKHFQLLLHDVGHEPEGGFDGVYGDNTATALKQYWQAKHGKEYNGRKVTAYVLRSINNTLYGGGSSEPAKLNLSAADIEFLAAFINEANKRDDVRPGSLWHVLDWLRHDREFFAKYF